MKPKQLKLGLAGAGVLLLIGLGYAVWVQKLSMSTVGQEDNQNQVPTSSDVLTTSDWKTYLNTEHGFTLRYPAGSTIETFTETNPYYRIVRIENISGNGYRLPPGEYYLEIFFGNTERSCEEELAQSMEVSVNGITGYRGTVVDAFAKRYVLCINRDGQNFELSVAEGSETGTIANAILDSFEFTGR